MPLSNIVDQVVVEDYVHAKKPVPEGKSYVIRVDSQTYSVASHKITGTEILGLAGKLPTQWKLYLHKAGRPPEKVLPDQVVNLREHQITHFSTIAVDATEGSGVPSCQ